MRRFDLCLRRWVSLAIAAAALIPAGISAQELPHGGGSVPTLRRGADGKIEVAPTNAAPATAVPANGPARSQRSDRGSAPAVEQNSKAPEVRATAAPRALQPLINVTPAVPRISDKTPLGGVVASYSVVMSDGSPFAGTVRFAAPHYDSKQMFALSGDKIIVNPNGPGLRSTKRSATYTITLETVP